VRFELGRWSFWAAALLLLVRCHPESSEPGITLLIESPADSLDDRLALSGNGQRLAQLIAPGLITFDDQGEPLSELAQSYRQLDPLTLEFTLREGLRFHDGTALTSLDVKAMFDALLERSFSSPKADKFDAISRIEAPDPRTILFHLKRPYAPILAELTVGIVPRQRARGPSAALQDEAPVGAGPFRFSSRQGDDQLELLAFPGYYQGKPRIPRLLVRVVRDETARVLELLKGRADLVLGDISPAVLPAVQRNPSLRILTRPGTGYSYVGFNLRGPPFSDLRVRRALCKALDIPLIAKAKFHDLAVTATGMLPHTHWAYSATSGCQRDVSEAATLLSEAGYITARSRELGASSSPAKPPLRFTLKTSSDRLRKSVALIIKEQLGQLGVEVELRALEFGTFFNDVRKGNFDAVTLKWASVIEPDLMRDVFSSRNIPTVENQFSGLNRGGYVNAQLDALLERAAGVDRAQRLALYQKAQETLDRDLPYLPLWHEDRVAVVSSRLRDFQPSAQGFLKPLASAREVNP
jgi:peptide/nickel transport system substrate-binding protein